MISSIYSAIFLVKSSKFPVTADDSFDGSGCVAVAAAAAVNGFDGGGCVAVAAAAAVNGFDGGGCVAVVAADDGFDGGGGCVAVAAAVNGFDGGGCVAVAAAVNGFDGGGCVAVAVAVNSTILSSKSLILKLKFFKFFKTSKSTTPSISFDIGEIRSASLLIQLFIDADL